MRPAQASNRIHGHSSRSAVSFCLCGLPFCSYFSWLDALSYIKYSYVGIALNEFSGLELSCTPAQLRNGKCPTPDGETSIKALGLDYISIGQTETTRKATRMGNCTASVQAHNARNTMHASSTVLVDRVCVRVV